MQASLMKSRSWLALTCVAVFFSGMAVAQVDDSREVTAERERQACLLTGLCDAPPGNIRPQVVILKFAAIAVSRSTAASGSSHGQNSLADAQNEALRNCSTAARDCELIRSGANACYALAVSGAAKFSAGGGSREDAAKAALAGCSKATGKSCYVKSAPCGGDDARWASPLPLPPGSKSATVDPKTVGTWKLLINPGYWIWQISRDGVYQFHSEAGDNATTHAGTFKASNGEWKLHAISGFDDDDGGTYVFQGPNTMVMTSNRYGPGIWVRE